MTTSTDPSRDDEAVRERFRKLRVTNDPALRNALVVDHTWIARTVARRFDQRGEAFDDLFQVASLGLVKAVDRFDPEMGTNFVSFATRSLRNFSRIASSSRAGSVDVDVEERVTLGWTLPSTTSRRG